MPSCDDCVIVFENIHDLQNHVKRWCEEGLQNHIKCQKAYGLTLKRERPIHPDSDDDDEMSYPKKRKVSNDKVLKVDPWYDIVEEAFERRQSEYDTKVNALMEKDSDISEQEAKEDVFRDMRETYRIAIMNSLAHKLIWLDAFIKDPIYNAIKKKMNYLMDQENFDQLEALKYVLSARTFIFDQVLDKYDTASVGSDPENSEDDDNDD